MFMADLLSQLGRVCCQVKRLFRGWVWVGKIACTGALKEPQERNFMGFMQLPSCTISARPPTSDDQNLDSMERPLSLESIHIYFDKISSYLV